MAANGISTLSTKQLKQEAKLDKATAKRQGKVVARDGTITGSIDSTKNYYRAANTLDINLLPTKYTGNAITNNANGAVQVAGSGLISASTSSNIVTGSGTSFTTLTVGTVMTSTYGNFGIGTIASIQSDTQLTLTSNSIVGHSFVVWQYLGSQTLVAGRPWTNAPVTSYVGTIDSSVGNPFTFKVRKSDNSGMASAITNTGWILTWTDPRFDNGGFTANQINVRTQTGSGFTSVASEDATFYNFAGWFGASVIPQGTQFTINW